MEEMDVIIGRFLCNQASDNDLKKLVEWLNSSEENKVYFSKMKKAAVVWDLQYRGNEWKNEFELFKKNVSKNNKNGMIKFMRLWQKAAAILILPLMIAALFWYVNYSEKSNGSQNLVEYYTPEGVDAKLTLEDGTMIWLNANSKIKYTSDFNKRDRKIKLSGEAFFKVAHNKNKPFVVSVNGLKIKVLGTVFNVNAYQASIVETSLRQGKVELIGENFKTRKILYPGEKAIYQVSNGDVSVNSIDPNVIGNWKLGQMVFSNTSMKDVIIALEKRYGVKITIKNKEIYNYRFTATIAKESLQELLNLIKVSSPINYEINNKEVTIYKK